MFRFVEGDLFDSEAQILVNTVNCVGVMGKGVALAFKNRYPKMFRDYKAACEQGNLRPGKLHVWEAPTGTTIVNFPTKRHWKQPSRYEDIEVGLTALHALLQNRGTIRVALPALGCGHGGLDWDRVSGMIRKQLAGLEAEIWVYGPAFSQSVNGKAHKEQSVDLFSTPVALDASSTVTEDSATHSKSERNGSTTDPVSLPMSQPIPLESLPPTSATTFPRRLIEVDLPIARISAHARREKSIRHGHISTLHIWWARRPLAACRAVICAALWPDPADPLCPPRFREEAARLITEFANKVVGRGQKIGPVNLEATSSPETFERWKMLANLETPLDLAVVEHQNVLRYALLDFIADFANWDNSTVPAYLETSRALTQVAHESLGGEPGTRPLVVDPFAGGGSIPLEALRVGADAFASDLNPVAVLLNKVVLEYIPKYGATSIRMKNPDGEELTFQGLAEAVRYWGQWIKKNVEEELRELYPVDPNGATPAVYVWARTIQCEGIRCGATIPLLRSLWVAKKGKRSVALRTRLNHATNQVEFEVVEGVSAKEVGQGFVKAGSATCPFCGFTTPIQSVREQIRRNSGAAATSQLIFVSTTHAHTLGRFYRAPTKDDFLGVSKAISAFRELQNQTIDGIPLIPNESPPLDGTGSKGGGYRTRKYGITRFGDFFTPRQTVSLTSLVKQLRQLNLTEVGGQVDSIGIVVRSCLALAVSRHVDKNASFVMWDNTREMATHVFARQALPIVWDFAEVNTLGELGGSFFNGVEWICRVIGHISSSIAVTGSVYRASAVENPLPDDSVNALVTDPPYYDAVPYADLSDFVYVWLRRMLPCDVLGYSGELTPKQEECVVDIQRGQDGSHFEKTMSLAMNEGRRVICGSGVGVVVFAHKTTQGWETQLQAMINARWTITGSWPIDTEMGNRLRAQNSAALASSVHLVCRPRNSNEIGDWRTVLTELPVRMHEWMPRLASEGVVGADAIFACLGPALEIFSRYSRVEKANGDPVSLKEYLEHVWAAVSKEAISTIFRDADASGLEPDARLTAMWLWTLGGNAERGARNTDSEEEIDAVEEEEEDEAPKSEGKSTGFTLEFDAARKIAQGLGIHLEKSESIVHVKGDKARLLAVGERTKYLFGKATEPTAGTKKTKKKPVQRSLFEEFEEAEVSEGGWKELQGPPPGSTVLDRLHQAMILFGAQRGELLKRFLVEDGVGKDARFWKLAQSLAALYPTGTEERRWVEGVLARKKGLGL